MTVDMSSSSAMKKFVFEGQFQADDILKHTEAFFAGDLKPSLKSEEPAPEDTAGAVKILKGKSFHELVMDNDKDVLVEFYAPWCGHCKKLEPIYNDLAEQMSKSHPHVVIAKMDSTQNEVDVEGVNVEGFPTIYFFKGSDKASPKKYEGARELKDFVAFLEKNAPAPVKSEL